jgi:hypothetical protein
MLFLVRKRRKRKMTKSIKDVSLAWVFVPLFEVFRGILFGLYDKSEENHISLSLFCVFGRIFGLGFVPIL